MDSASKKHIARSALGLLLVVVGLVCLAVAAILGFGMQTVRTSSARGGESAVEVPNVTAAGAAAGFAIAGGLCFLATAIAESRDYEAGSASSSIP